MAQSPSGAYPYCRKQAMSPAFRSLDLCERVRISGAHACSRLATNGASPSSSAGANVDADQGVGMIRRGSPGPATF